MVTAQDIAGLRRASRDYKETQRLKAKIAARKKERRPFYLTRSEFDEILHWKLRGQYGRGEAQREANSGRLIREITCVGLNLTHPDPDYETELRIEILCTLRGVGVPVASAVLALTFPRKYAVIDFRGWRQVFEEERRTFTVPDYKGYLEKVKKLADELGWPVQEVDLAIWEYDMRQHPR